MEASVNKPDWNPRYVAYAKSKGNSPEKQLEEDKEYMAEFMIWINSKWDEWHKAIGKRKEFHTLEDHAAFDKWLKGKNE